MTAVDTLITELQANDTALNAQPVVCAIQNLVAALQQLQAGSGGSISVTDGVTTVNPTTEVDFTSGATVTDGGGGKANVAVTAGGAISVTDGVTTVNPTTEVNFTSGATVTNGGGGIADVAIAAGGSLSVTDGTTTVNPTTTLDFTGGVAITNAGGGTAQALVTAVGNWNLPVTLVGSTNFTLENSATFSTATLTLATNAGAGVGVLNLSNTNNAGASAITFRDDAGTEHCAFGYSNSGNVSPFGSHVFLEASNYNGGIIATPPPNFSIIQTGDFAGQGTAPFVRQTFDGTLGDITLFQKDGVTAGLTVSGNGYVLFTAPIGNNNAGDSTKVENKNNAGASTLIFNDLNGTAHAGIGYANPGYVAGLADTNYIITVDKNFNFLTTGTFHIAAFLDVTNGYFGLGNGVPATSTSPGEAGDIAWDTGFFYVCTAVNTWKRVGLTTF